MSTATRTAEFRTYRGYGPDQPHAALVMIEEGGALLGPLQHCAWHSTTGMSWGYCGSGPADLARSLLIDALGGAARCTVCAGTARVVYDIVADAEIPLRDADPDVTVFVEGEWQPRYSDPMRCAGCQGGYAVSPALYQQFKRDVVSKLEANGWTLTSADILQWIGDHR